ncbi:TPA: hypothetical protein ACWKRV_003612 [Escherichia coli]|uniref:hypothetical protein n=1 Tax=Escherichia coli TaxID=562 RepID=UPI000DA5D895|nr:hypothetical protein [Escherichia coli]EFD4951807.1 hypothetical protein [Escherichia coli]EFE8012941.1 hypothetical protein [Escherichia coli]QMM09007.1 hypothetical protein HVX20_00255 [Escherichia coli]QMM14610.1 hypothetical protein HVX19_00255 [Escherichia coli]QMM25167.1 hypothetical protein HVX17_00255 [Escherichia coli]
MTNNISNINNTAHNKNLDKTTFDEQPAYETRVSQAKKILQSFAPNDIKVDTNTKFISLIESVRALSPELQCKVLDGLNYAKNTLHNINQNSAIATKSSCQSTESIEKIITFNILDMLDNLTMRQQNIMEAFLRVFTSMYNASAKADASMSIVFEQLVHLQSNETKNASWANFAGALAGSAINATGAVFMAGAELAKPAGKIDDIAENQEQNTDKPDSQTRIKSKEDMANAKARLAEIDNQQKDLSNNKNIEDNDKQEQSSKLQKEKESITNKIKDKEKINSHNLRYGITSSISHTNNLFQSIANLSQYGGTVAAEHTRAEKDLAEQAKNVMHSVMSSYLDQINRDVQGRDQALNLLQQIIQTIIDTDSAIVQGIRS